MACLHGLPVGRYVTPITSRRNGRPTTPRPGLCQLARGNTSTTLPRRATVVEWLSYATLQTRKYLQGPGMWRTTRQKYGGSSKSRVDQPQPNTADVSDTTEPPLFHDHRILEATWRSILDEGDWPQNNGPVDNLSKSSLLKRTRDDDPFELEFGSPLKKHRTVLRDFGTNPCTTAKFRRWGDSFSATHPSTVQVEKLPRKSGLSLEGLSRKSI